MNYRSSATPLLLPEMRLRTNNTRKIKNRILAMLAAPAATPPNPNMAAIIAITKKITVQRNITFNFKLDNMVTIDIKHASHFKQFPMAQILVLPMPSP